MHIISNTALISINETAIVQLISFLIFLFLMHKIMFRPLRGVTGDREAYVKKVKQEVIDAKKKVEDLSIQFQKQRNRVREEAFGITKKMEELGKQEVKNILRETRQDISEIREQAVKDVQTQVAEAQRHIKEEAEILTKDIVEKILCRRPAQ